MARVISVEAERFPIAGTFTISRGSKTEAEVITCTISQDAHRGRGECVPYKRYGETMDGVHGAIEAMRERIAGGIDRTALLDAMPAGAARNAVDCALWDLEARLRCVRWKPPTRCRLANPSRWRRRPAPTPAARC
jgi:L-alanine-DL-glutamate epimerase-like enolase superfamily enzyme